MKVEEVGAELVEIQLAANEIKEGLEKAAAGASALEKRAESLLVDLKAEGNVLNSKIKEALSRVTSGAHDAASLLERFANPKEVKE